MNTDEHRFFRKESLTRWVTPVWIPIPSNLYSSVFIYCFNCFSRTTVWR